MPKRAALDDTQIAEQLVRSATGTKRAKGESLLGSPELQKAFREAKKKEAERSKKRKK